MKPLHVFLLLLLVAVWGVNFVFVKIGLQELPPMLLCSARFFLMSFPGIFFFKRPAVPFKWVILYAFVMFILQFALIFSGMKAGISAGLASILLQIQAFFSLLFAALLLKETLSPWQILGALVSFSGIAIAGWYLEADATLLGFLLILAAAIAWGLGSVIVKKMGKTQSGSLLTWASVIAWPPLLLLSLFIENSQPVLLNLHLLSPLSYAAILFIAFGSTAFGFGVWNWLLQVYPLSTMAPFTLLIPIFGMLSSAIFLGEELESWKILSGSLVIGGLSLNLVGARLIAKNRSSHARHLGHDSVIQIADDPKRTNDDDR